MVWVPIEDLENGGSVRTKLNALGQSNETKAESDEVNKIEMAGNGSTLVANREYVGAAGGASYTIPACAVDDVIVLYASDDYASSAITLNGDAGVTIDGGASYSWNVQKTLTLRATGTNTWVKSLAPDESGASTVHAWIPLTPFDTTSSNWSHLSFDSIPADLMTSNADWIAGFRIVNASNRDDSGLALICTNVATNGISWRPKGDYFLRMTTSSYLLSCDNDTPAQADPFWILLSYDSSAGQLSAWVSGVKEMNGRAVSYSATAPTTMVFGSENAGYTSAYFYGFCGMGCSSLVWGTGSTLTDADASEFVRSVNDVSELSAPLQAKIDSNITFDAAGTVVSKGAIDLSPIDNGTGAHAFVETVK